MFRTSFSRTECVTEYKSKLQDELNDFLIYLDEQAQVNGRTLEEELADLEEVSCGTLIHYSKGRKPSSKKKRHIK